MPQDLLSLGYTCELCVLSFPRSSSLENIEYPKGFVEKPTLGNSQDTQRTIKNDSFQMSFY